MTFLPECGACVSSLTVIAPPICGLIMICQIWWNKKYKDLEQVRQMTALVLFSHYYL